MARVALLFLALAACSKRQPSPEQPAPSASVIALGVSLGACDDLPACARECDGGSGDRCRRLAATYAFAVGVEKDEARATGLYDRGCELKDPPACVFAGQMHEYAHGVPKDDVAAERSYERACDLGWPAGCYNVAIMLENGRGVPRDLARAAELYQAACTAGSKVACRKAQGLHEADASRDQGRADRGGDRPTLTTTTTTTASTQNSPIAK